LASKKKKTQKAEILKRNIKVKKNLKLQEKCETNLFCVEKEIQNKYVLFDK